MRDKVATRLTPADIERARTIDMFGLLTARGRTLKRQGRGSPEYAGPCPLCGGRDRFAINTAKLLWVCRGCQRGGDVIALIQHLDNCTFIEAVRYLIGNDIGRISCKPLMARSSGPNCKPVDHIDLALTIWHETQPMGMLGKRYLASRELELPPQADEVLRFHPSCPFGGGARHPCLVALYRDIVSNAPCAVHRTALTADGRKIERKALGPTSGAAIKLYADEMIESGLFIGEGIETVLRGIRFGLRPAWALGCAGAIRAFPVLRGIETLTILVDNDLPDQNGRRVGQDAAQSCGMRWAAAGHEVRLITPNRPGTDMADILPIQRGE
jgi:hypothetical protein